ncbi:MAG TPA: hypothetical protein VIH61_10270 [Waddliaceae bacterium]
MENTNDPFDHSKSTRYTIQIGENIAERIDQHLRLLKFLGDKDVKKQKWIKNAILKKLDKEEHIPPYELPKEKHLNIDVEKNLRERIERVINSIRKVRRTYSKKQWILEAIAEQLTQEEDVVKRQVKENVRGD